MLEMLSTVKKVYQNLDIQVVLKLILMSVLDRWQLLSWVKNFSANYKVSMHIFKYFAKIGNL